MVSLLYQHSPENIKYLLRIWNALTYNYIPLLNKNSMRGGVRWPMTLIPALGTQTQEDICEFMISLVYIVSSRPDRFTQWDPISKRKAKKALNRSELDWIMEWALINMISRHKKVKYPWESLYWVSFQGTADINYRFILQTVIFKEVLNKTQITTVEINRSISNNDRLKCHFNFIPTPWKPLVSSKKFKQDDTTHLNQWAFERAIPKAFCNNVSLVVTSDTYGWWIVPYLIHIQAEAILSHIFIC